MASVYDLVSRDAQQALNEFSTAFDAALAVADPDTWARRYGLVNSSRAIRTTYPLSISAAGYVERKGDDKMRKLYERSLSMKMKEWVDGIQEKRIIIEAPDFVGWMKEPANIAREGARQPQILVASVLEDNGYLDLYRQELPGGSVASAIRLFANNHPVNIFDSAFGTFDNMHTITGGFTSANVSAIKQRFRAKKGPNGKSMNLEFNTLLIPAALEEQARDFFEADVIATALKNVAGTENVAAVANRNRYKGTVTPVVCPELTSDTIVYPLDANSLAYPWILQDGGAPEEIRFDTNSDYYKQTGLIGVKYVLQMGAAAALPHAIEQITLS